MNKLNILALIAIVSLSIVSTQSTQEIVVGERLRQIQDRCQLTTRIYTSACNYLDNQDSCYDEINNHLGCYERCLENKQFSVCKEECSTENPFLQAIFDYLNDCLYINN